jgi:hypothetical protein
MKVKEDDKPDFVLVHGMGDDKSGFYKPLDFIRDITFNSTVVSGSR